jgi:D-glycero-D-manno-heptose 1,7-bisphosphate phosphatase
MNQAIFLDRDGVLIEPIIRNRLPFSPQSINEIKFVKDCKLTVLKFKEMGFIPIIITNQPDVSRGLLSLSKLSEINQHILEYLEIDFIFNCLHDDNDNCGCRKPKPGMLISASKKLNIDLTKSYMVGDRWKDIECGQMAGCRNFFIDYEYCEVRPTLPFITISSLSDLPKLIERQN